MARRTPTDTSLGGSAGRFPETTIGLVARFGRDYRSGVEELCRRYWKPVYTFLRIGHAKSNEDAKDLAQAFFLWLTEAETLKKYEAERGALRTFLKVLLKRFVSHHDRDAHRLKRGGAFKIANIADVEIPAAAKDPDAEFDRAWLQQLTRTAVDRVRERMNAAGRAVRFQVFELYDLRPAEEQPTYAAVGERLGLKPADVRDILAAVRREVRTEIRVELAKMTLSPAGLEEEWRALFGG